MSVTRILYPHPRALRSAAAFGLVVIVGQFVTGCGPLSVDPVPLPADVSDAAPPALDGGVTGGDTGVDGGVDGVDGGVDASVDAGSGNAAPGRTLFLAFGVAAPDDPEGQKNLLEDQVSKVLSSAVAGGRVATADVVVGASEVSPAVIRARLEAYRQTLEATDSVVIYSHGHGSTKGLVLAFDRAPTDMLRWHEYADLLLRLPAKNVVVFTTACHSGALADVLKSEPFASRWQGRSKAGRSFIVLTAVAADESATATDVRIGDPSAIGNPFTYAVRTAIDGQADGFVGTASTGPADGITSLRELTDYVLFTAHEKARTDDHHPQLAGEFVDSERFPLARH